MFDESGAVQAVEVVGGPISEENKDIMVRTLCVCVCVCVCTAVSAVVGPLGM